jgi:predicted metal-dependent peptidase
MLAEKLTQEQRLHRAYFEIINQSKYVHLASIMMHGTHQVVDAEITACTDGRDVAYGRKFLEALSNEEVRFLILHEVYHKMYRHLRTWKHLHDKDAQCANQACDYVINLQIAEENHSDGFATMPEGGCLDRRFRNMSTQQVFDIIYQEKQEEGGGGGGGKPIDDHDWDGAKELSDEEVQELEDQIEGAIREGAILAGKQGAGLSDSFKELLKPKVDWRKVTRKFVSEQCVGRDYGTYARPNRRFIGSDIYLPSLVSETIPELLVALDTSGSCWSALPYFLAEVKSICSTIKPHKLHLMFWDTNVVYEMHEGNNVEDLKVKDAYGGGGTDVNCVTTYLKEHNIKPTASVILTDGYLSNGWGKWDHPVLWCLVNNKTDVPPKGKFVRVEDWRN